MGFTLWCPSGNIQEQLRANRYSKKMLKIQDAAETRHMDFATTLYAVVAVDENKNYA